MNQNIGKERKKERKKELLNELIRILNVYLSFCLINIKKTKLSERKKGM